MMLIAVFPHLLMGSAGQACAHGRKVVAHKRRKGGRGAPAHGRAVGLEAAQEHEPCSGSVRTPGAPCRSSCCTAGTPARTCVHAPKSHPPSASIIEGAQVRQTPPDMQMQKSFATRSYEISANFPWPSGLKVAYPALVHCQRKGTWILVGVAGGDGHVGLRLRGPPPPSA